MSKDFWDATLRHCSNSRHLTMRKPTNKEPNNDFNNYKDWWFPLRFNTLRPRQSCRHFADDILKCISLNRNLWIPLTISLTFVPKVRINNIPVLVQILAWCRPGGKPLSVPMMVNLLTHVCVTRPQWVKMIIFIQWQLNVVNINATPLHWRHNGHDSVSNHQPYCCLLNCLFRRRSKIISKLRVTGLCAGNSPETGEFPAQMASNADVIMHCIWGNCGNRHTRERRLSSIRQK